MEPEANETTPHPDFLKGFNQGYILSQHEPELAEKLADALGQTERGKGFQGGRQEYLQEKQRHQSPRPGWLRDNYHQDLNKEHESNQQPDKEDNTPDKN